MSINVGKYIEGYLKIRNKQKEIVPLKMNAPQKRLYDVLKAQSEAGKPMRVIILKARQMGFSTLTEAVMFALTATDLNVESGIVTHLEKATANMLKMVKLFYSELPDNLKPQTVKSNDSEIYFNDKRGDGLNSRICCMTAGGRAIGRSYTFQNLHLSEYAWWTGDKKTTLAGLTQAVPSEPGTMIVIESTANGYDDFKDRWDAAVAGESDYYPLFAAWWELPEYRMPVPKNFAPTDKERELIKLYGLDYEQLQWRRWCIKNNCSGDEAMFRQEYPSCPEEAFLTTGESIFQKDKIVARIEELKKEQAPKIGVFEYRKRLEPITDRNGDVVRYRPRIDEIRFVEKENGYIRIAREPEKKTDREGRVTHLKPYALGGDTAGVGEDYFTAKVVDCMTGESAATLQKQNMDEDEYAEQVYCLGKYYNDALIAVETNYSESPTETLVNLGYKPLYIRETVGKVDKQKTDSYGFDTNPHTRPVIIANMVAEMRDNAVLETDIATLKEMLTFIKNARGRAEAQTGYHDDLVMATAIARYIKLSRSPKWTEVKANDSDVLVKLGFKTAEKKNGRILPKGYVEW